MRGIEAFFRGDRGPTTQRRRLGGSAATRTLTLVVGALSLLLAACSGGLGGQGSAGTLAATQTFTWPYNTSTGVFGHNEVLDPSVVSTVYDANDISMLYMGLVTFLPSNQVVGDAAAHIDVDSTGTIYTFHLRPNLAFSDGSPITAADFAYSLDRSLDPNLCPVNSAKTYSPGNCYWAGPTYLGAIYGAQDRISGAISTMIGSGDDPTKGLDVLDAQTLRIRLQPKQPIAYFLNALTYSTADVVEKSVVTNPQYAGGLWVDHLDKGGTSGPFKLASYGGGTKLTFEPNPYWEKAFGQKLTLTQVIRPVVPTVNQEYNDYRAGAYDYTDVPSDQYTFARGQSDFHSTSALFIEYFGLNTQTPPFNITAVRQAFDLALNKQFLVDSVDNGGAIPTNHIVPQGMPGFDVNLTNPPPDGTQSLTGNNQVARALIQQAQAKCPPPGTFGAPAECAYITGSSPTEIDIYAPEEDSGRIALAKAAATMWNTTLGVNVVVKPVPFTTEVGYIIMPAAQDPMPMWEIGWAADYPDPQDWLSLQFITGAGNNSMGFSDPKLDAQMKAADLEQDQVKRMQMYNQVEQAIVNASPWIPFEQSKQYWRQRPYVHGFGYNSFGIMEEHNWLNVYIAQH
jgi:oligopeptide transport system substrate-binding protein